MRCSGAVERAVHARRVVIIPAFIELRRQVDRVPEKYLSKILAPNRADQPLHERMRRGRVRNGLDLLNFDHAQVGKPAVEAKQRVIVGTEVAGKRLTGVRERSAFARKPENVRLPTTASLPHS